MCYNQSIIYFQSEKYFRSYCATTTAVKSKTTASIDRVKFLKPFFLSLNCVINPFSNKLARDSRDKICLRPFFYSLCPMLRSVRTVKTWERYSPVSHAWLDLSERWPRGSWTWKNVTSNQRNQTLFVNCDGPVEGTSEENCCWWPTFRQLERESSSESIEWCLPVDGVVSLLRRKWLVRKKEMPP